MPWVLWPEADSLNAEGGQGCDNVLKGAHPTFGVFGETWKTYMHAEDDLLSQPIGLILRLSISSISMAPRVGTDASMGWRATL